MVQAKISSQKRDTYASLKDLMFLRAFCQRWFAGVRGDAILDGGCTGACHRLTPTITERCHQGCVKWHLTNEPAFQCLQVCTLDINVDAFFGIMVII